MLVQLLLLLVATGQARPPAPPRDGAPPKAGSAIISGRITERDSNRPLTRAIVTVVPSTGTGQLEALTNADGRYEVTGLEPGALIVRARDAQETTSSSRSIPRAPYRGLAPRQDSRNSPRQANASRSGRTKSERST